jgi:hypothetical protein
MNWWQRMRGRWRMEDELDAELRFHFDRLVADYIAEGVSAEDARRRARTEFGGVEAVKDACRDARGTRWVHDIAQDVRFSARLLARERSFTLVAVVALALGIGVNNTQFTVVNAICLRGLPIEEPDRVVDVSDRDEAHRRVPLSARQVDDLLGSRPASIEALSAYVSRPATLRDDQFAAERIVVAYVSTNAFAVIRQHPLLGRDFRADDGRAGEAPSRSSPPTCGARDMARSRGLSAPRPPRRQARFSDRGDARWIQVPRQRRRLAAARRISRVPRCAPAERLRPSLF